MKIKKFEAVMWVLSLGGLALTIGYVMGTKLGFAIPFGVAIVGVLMALVASLAFFIYWLYKTVGFAKEKQYLMVLVMIVIGLFVFRGFWMR